MIENISTIKCTGCGICVEFCPLDNLGLDISQEEFPPCQEACPAATNIRGCLYRLKRGELNEAVKLIREALPFPAITGRVCFHPCETECARKELDEAVNINALERFVGDRSLKEKAEPVPRRHAARVAIAGSGPAGLSAAYFLVKIGYGVTVFEKMSQLGGMLRTGIMEYRLPRDILDSQINYFRDIGVEFSTDTAIGPDLSLGELKANGYKAVFLVFGAQKSRKLDIAGIGLDGVLWGLDFLRDINLKRKAKVGDRVTIVGGGDVAMDVALSCLRLGAKEVTVVCLEPADEMPAHEESLKQVIDEGIHVHVSWGPKRILGRDETVAGIELVRCISVFDKEGRFNPCFNEKKTKSLETDMVIFAIGQSPDLSHLPEGIKTTEAGTIAVDPVTLETSLPGVFAGGDVVSGPSSVVEAIAAGKRAAISIDRYLRGEDLKADREKERARVTNLPREGIEKKARIPTPFLPISKRCWSFKEVKAGFTEEVALSEVQRCMTCGSKAYISHDDCMTCFQCEILCPSGAIDVHPFKEVLPLAIEYQAGGASHG